MGKIQLAIEIEAAVRELADAGELWIVYEGDALPVRRTQLERGVIRYDEGFGSEWVLVRALCASDARELARQYDHSMHADVSGLGHLVALTGVRSAR